ncbi:MAG: ShlB/FhaC/HecB family hemolysin secretion/activation protein [Thioploca sp.]|nr:ShlB/FhaC/HecB family hemolysin secretion/activation protein [Thioploca sp.]
MDELQAVKNKLTQYYLDKGYLIAMVIIPDQVVNNDIVTLEIRESYPQPTSRNEWLLRKQTVRRRLQTDPQNYWCKPIANRLRPSLQQATNELTLQEEETRPYLFNINLNNHNVPTWGGGFQEELSLVHYDLTNRQDVLNVCYKHQEEKNNADYAIEYSIPLFNQKTAVAIGFGRSEAEVTEVPFEQIEIESEADYWLTSLRHLFYNANNQYLIAFLKLQRINQATTLLGQPFSFPDGGKDGKSTTTTLSIGHEWMFFKDHVRTISTYSSFNFGLDAFDATIDGYPDGEYFSSLIAFSWAERLRLLNSRLFFYTLGYYTNDSLLSLAKFALGGADTVRGYRENILVRERAFLTAIEWQIPVIRWRIPYLSKSPEDGLVYLAPFFDYGWGSDVETPHFTEQIYSIGLGTYWRPSETIATTLYWGHALNNNIPKPTEHDLQDDGIHFEISLQLW